jgi:hypothetical protein
MAMENDNGGFSLPFPKIRYSFFPAESTKQAT